MEKLTDVAGIGPASAKLLADHQVKTVAALAAIKLAELQKIPGFGGELRARAVKQAAADYLKGKKTAPKTAKSGQTQTTAVTATAATARKASVAGKSLAPVEPEHAAIKEKKAKDKKKDNKKNTKAKSKEKKAKDKKKSKKKGKNKKKS